MHCCDFNGWFLFRILSCLYVFYFLFCFLPDSQSKMQKFRRWFVTIVSLLPSIFVLNLTLEPIFLPLLFIYFLLFSSLLFSPLQFNCIFDENVIVWCDCDVMGRDVMWCICANKFWLDLKAARNSTPIDWKDDMQW